MPSDLTSLLNLYIVGQL